MPASAVRTNNDWCYAGPSRIEGRGLFARVEIPTGTDIVAYEGPKLLIKEGEALAKAGNVYIFRLNRRDMLDGSVKWNLGRHANHSCDPNAKSVSVDGHIWLRALRPIAKNEEITYNYGYSFRDDPTPCHCGAATCRGQMNTR